MFRITFSLLALVSMVACGGSSSDSSNRGMIIEGQLTEGIGDQHKIYKHVKDEAIEDVEICALGECSITDGQGQFGFRLNENFEGGQAEFSIEGHGISTKTIVNLPKDASDVFVHFEHGADGKAHIHHMEVDGERVEANHQHDEHAHNHN